MSPAQPHRPPLRRWVADRRNATRVSRLPTRPAPGLVGLLTIWVTVNLAAWCAAVAGVGVESECSDARRRRRQRGDVPGWVLVTLMTAGLVTILYALARDQLTALFTRAINSVTGQP